MEFTGEEFDTIQDALNEALYAGELYTMQRNRMLALLERIDNREVSP